ncbi:uncharacterized protein ARMOST_02255 [Armillaria ostoyae]|uniref:Uncharacterized protein n=1 Tax=Armillaria ostoyae TaxID=47428 RepID=A0A284QR87_ARMOS|nr:uncharacterized protein ARMOST_02255 [Armillaria ostoyae]
MCHLRQVRNVYIRCGHAFSLPDEYVWRIAIFDASNPTASLVFFILRAANHQLVCRPVGSTVAFLNSTPPTSIHIAPPAAPTSQTKTADEVLA